MCQMIVFWHSCRHIYASYLQCPFKDFDGHEEELATAATVYAECWACKMTECPVTKQLKTSLLTVEHFEMILDKSSTEPDFLQSVIEFYARGDHSRYWNQPGHRKAEYVVDDPYMADMCAEACLSAAARTGEFACNAGFEFDLKIAQAARRDPQNYDNLNWRARGVYPKYPFYYQLSDRSQFQPPGIMSHPEPRDSGEVQRPVTLSEESLRKRQASNRRYGTTTTLDESSGLALSSQHDDSPLSTENGLTIEIPRFCHDTTESIQNSLALGDSKDAMVPISTNANGPIPNGFEDSAQNNLAVPLGNNFVVPTQSDITDPFVDSVTSFVPNAAATSSLSNGATTPFLERLINSMRSDTARPTQNELTSRVQASAVVPSQGNEQYNLDYQYSPSTTNGSRISHDTGQLTEANANYPNITVPHDGPKMANCGHSFGGGQRGGEHSSNQDLQDYQHYPNAFVSYQAYQQLIYPTPTSTAGAFPEPSKVSNSSELPRQVANSQALGGLDDVSAFMLDDASMDDVLMDDASLDDASLDGNPSSRPSLGNWADIYGQDTVRDVMQDSYRATVDEAYSQTEE